MSRPVSILLMALFLVAHSVIAGAQSPPPVILQAHLQDADGVPIAVAVDVTVTLYDGPDDGSETLWSARYRLQPEDGRLNLPLPPDPQALSSTGGAWVGVQVDQDPEMLPRIRLESVPYAVRAAWADNALSTEEVTTMVRSDPGVVSVNPACASNEVPTTRSGTWSCAPVPTVPGASGAVGPVGPVGPEGPAGLRGPEGPSGHSVSVASSARPPGCAGSGVELTTGSGVSAVCDGVTGDRGPVGPVGPDGMAGDSVALGAVDPGHAECTEGGVEIALGGASQFVCHGATGPAGGDGPVGPVGPSGATGPTGAAGEPGPAGPVGLRGAAGRPGAIGPPGLVGPAGSEGPLGPIGPPGPLGPRGPDGAEGPVGLLGSVGPVGLQGPVGPAGILGPFGEVGPVGPVGRAGADAAPPAMTNLDPGSGGCDAGGLELWTPISGAHSVCHGVDGAPTSVLVGPRGAAFEPPYGDGAAGDLIVGAGLVVDVSTGTWSHLAQGQDLEFGDVDVAGTLILPAGHVLRATGSIDISGTVEVAPHPDRWGSQRDGFGSPDGWDTYSVAPPARQLETFLDARADHADRSSYDADVLMGEGGGALTVVASGPITISGTLRADGRDATPWPANHPSSQPGAGGAGGGLLVVISDDSITVTGTVSATGGDGSDGHLVDPASTSRFCGGGGGGGGLIHLIAPIAPDLAAAHVTVDGGGVGQMAVPNSPNWYVRAGWGASSAGVGGRGGDDDGGWSHHRIYQGPEPGDGGHIFTTITPTPSSLLPQAAGRSTP